VAIFLAIYSVAPLYVGKIVKGDSCFILLNSNYFGGSFITFASLLFVQIFAFGAQFSSQKTLIWPRAICLSVGVALLVVLGLTLAVNCVFPAFFASFQTTEP
jgi:hypothetical protein